MQATTALRQHPRLSPIGVATALFVAIAAFALASGAVRLPDTEGVLEDASRTLGSWAYPAVAGFAFLETAAFVGLVVPGETAVVVGGVVAERGDVQLVPLIALVWVAAAAGDITSFLLGRRLGRPFLVRHGARLRLTPERLVRVERFYDRHGGKAVLVGRFAGLVRAVSPFLAGASGLSLRRFVPWSLAGALLWSASFTLVGYGFSESFAESGETVAKIALAGAAVVALAFVVVARLRRGDAGRTARAREPQRRDRAENTQAGAHERSGHDVEREVHAQVHARQAHRGGDGEGRHPKPRAHDRDGGCGGEGRGAVTGGKRRVVRDRGERSEARIGHGRALTVEGLFQDVGHERGGTGGGARRREGQRQPATPDVRAQAEAHQQRTLDPPRGQQKEERGQQPVLEDGSGVHERPVEVQQEIHRRVQEDASKAGSLVLVLNGRASGIEDPQAMAGQLVALLEELGARAVAVVTQTEDDLHDALRSAAALGSRVILVGGDGSLHAAANAPLPQLPELALVPAGRANNVARALGIPTSRVGALSVALQAPARPLDALRVATPDRFLYAIEGVSAGFHAEARASYEADNSADLRQGLRALVRAVRRYAPYRARVELDSGQLGSGEAAQLFFSNLPYFGFGFHVDPGADPADGRFEAIVLEARSRRRLLRLLTAARRGRHLGRPGVRRVPATRAQLTEALPLVADAVPLGTTTATVTVDRARLRVAFPEPGAAR